MLDLHLCHPTTLCADTDQKAPAHLVERAQQWGALAARHGHSLPAVTAALVLTLTLAATSTSSLALTLTFAFTFAFAFAFTFAFALTFTYSRWPWF